MSRPLPPPTESRITAEDGWDLSLLDFAPESAAWGCVLMGHAMMVDRRTLCRPDRDTIAATLCEAGLRVLVADARGHGASGPLAHEGGRWGYDELVDDTGLLVARARELAPELPLALLGHSLFGHTSLAWLGMHPQAPVDAIVHFGSTVWSPETEPSRLKWAVKSAILHGTAWIAGGLGRAPIRRIGMGNMDEPAPYWKDFSDMSRRGCWSRRDGTSYREGLKKLPQPSLIISSEADPHFGNPREIDAFSSPLGKKRELLALGRLPSEHPLHAIVPDHMAMITDPSSRPVWEHVAAWLRATMRPDLSPPDKDAIPRTAQPAEAT